MLTLSIVFIFVISISQTINVWISQYKHPGTVPRYIYIQPQKAFLNPLNFFKSLQCFKRKKIGIVEYDQSQISKTVNLPRNIWPSIAEVNEAGIERQERVQKYWEDENVYHKICENKFYKLGMKDNNYKNVIPYFKIIYDGPPYANGRPHFGHFLNKTIKDVFLRFFLLQGKIPMMIPGWDCHGMPIEHKILKMYNIEDCVNECDKEIVEEHSPKETEEPEETQIMTYIGDRGYEEEQRSKSLQEFCKSQEEEEERERYRNCTEEDIKLKKWSVFVREKCKEYAYKSLKTQMNYFKKAGIWAFWSDYYATYHSSFENEVMNAFIDLKENKQIYKARLPQLYSSKSKSVLAESEILHRTEKVLSSYIAFKVDLESCSGKLLDNLKRKMEELGIKDLKLVAYTTTAYTVPGNKGLAVNSKGKYYLYHKGGCLYLMNDLVLNNRNDEFWSTFRHIESLDMLNNKEDVTDNMGGGAQKYPTGEGDVGASGAVMEEVVGGCPVYSSSSSGIEAQEDDSVGCNGGLDSNAEKSKYLIYGYALEDIEYYDPLYGNKYKVYSESFVEVNKGTGIVHLSPAHGFDDFNCIKKDGRFVESNNNGPLEYCNLFDEEENYYPYIHYHLQGINIRDMDEKMLHELIGDSLVKWEYRDKQVDIDWRCENQVHTRLTDQYCMALPPKEHLMDLMKSINIAPSSGARYLKNIISTRNRDWCISRQRFWGTPIPYNGEECMLEGRSWSEGTADRVWNKSRNVLDIVDVWFESALVREYTIRVVDSIMNRMLFKRGGTTQLDFTKMLQGVKKYVIEGQDQHRGWFQSVLIVSTLLQNKEKREKSLPFDNLFSHLFVTVNGQKLSKSKLNVNMTSEEEGTKQLVKMNKDEYEMNGTVERNAHLKEKVDEELRKIEYAITPGHDVCNLLNPWHPKLTEVTRASDAMENLSHLEGQNKEGLDDYEDYEEFKKLMSGESVQKEDGDDAEGMLVDNVLNELLRDSDDTSKTGFGNVNESDGGVSNKVGYANGNDGNKMGCENENRSSHWRSNNKSNVSNTYFNIDVLRTLACSNDFLTHDLDLTKDSLRSSKQTHKKIVNCLKYITSLLAQDRQAYDRESKSSGPKKSKKSHGGLSDEGQFKEADVTNPLLVHNATKIPEIRYARHRHYELNALDSYFLNLAYSLAAHCKHAYESAQFFKVIGLVERFMTNLSNVYFSYIKNFIYILPRDHKKNEAIKFVLNKVLYVLIKVLAPIMPHMCEDLFITLNPELMTVFSEKWPRRPKLPANTTSDMGIALTIRKIINKDHNNSSSCILKLEENHLTSVLPKLEDLGVDLRLVFNVAGVKLCKKLLNPFESGDIKYTLEESEYRKCKRCWLYKEDVEENNLCEQCRHIMESQS